MSASVAQSSSSSCIQWNSFNDWVVAITASEDLDNTTVLIRSAYKVYGFDLVAEAALLGDDPYSYRIYTIIELLIEMQRELDPIEFSGHLKHLLSLPEIKSPLIAFFHAKLPIKLKEAMFATCIRYDKEQQLLATDPFRSRQALHWMISELSQVPSKEHPDRFDQYLSVADELISLPLHATLNSLLMQMNSSAWEPYGLAMLHRKLRQRPASDPLRSQTLARVEHQIRLKLAPVPLDWNPQQSQYLYHTQHIRNFLIDYLTDHLRAKLDAAVKGGADESAIGELLHSEMNALGKTVKTAYSDGFPQPVVQVLSKLYLDLANTTPTSCLQPIQDRDDFELHRAQFYHYYYLLFCPHLPSDIVRRLSNVGVANTVAALWYPIDPPNEVSKVLSEFCAKLSLSQICESDEIVWSCFYLHLTRRSHLNKVLELMANHLRSGKIAANVLATQLAEGVLRVEDNEQLGTKLADTLRCSRLPLSFRLLFLYAFCKSIRLPISDYLKNYRLHQYIPSLSGYPAEAWTSKDSTIHLYPLLCAIWKDIHPKSPLPKAWNQLKSQTSSFLYHCAQAHYQLPLDALRWLAENGGSLPPMSALAVSRDFNMLHPTKKLGPTGLEEWHRVALAVIRLNARVRNGNLLAPPLEQIEMMVQCPLISPQTLHTMLSKLPLEKRRSLAPRILECLAVEDNLYLPAQVHALGLSIILHPQAFLAQLRKDHHSAPGSYLLSVAMSQALCSETFSRSINMDQLEQWRKLWTLTQKSGPGCQLRDEAKVWAPLCNSNLTPPAALAWIAIFGEWCGVKNLNKYYWDLATLIGQHTPYDQVGSLRQTLHKRLKVRLESLMSMSLVELESAIGAFHLRQAVQLYIVVCILSEASPMGSTEIRQLEHDMLRALARRYRPNPSKQITAIKTLRHRDQDVFAFLSQKGISLRKTEMLVEGKMVSQAPDLSTDEQAKLYMEPLEISTLGDLIDRGVWVEGLSKPALLDRVKRCIKGLPVEGTSACSSSTAAVSSSSACASSTSAKSDAKAHKHLMKAQKAFAEALGLRTLDDKTKRLLDSRDYSGLDIFLPKCEKLHQLTLDLRASALQLKDPRRRQERDTLLYRSQLMMSDCPAEIRQAVICHK